MEYVLLCVVRTSVKPAMMCIIYSSNSNPRNKLRPINISKSLITNNVLRFSERDVRYHTHALKKDPFQFTSLHNVEALRFHDYAARLAGREARGPHILIENTDLDCLPMKRLVAACFIVLWQSSVICKKFKYLIGATTRQITFFRSLGSLRNSYICRLKPGLSAGFKEFFTSILNRNINLLLSIIIHIIPNVISRAKKVVTLQILTVRLR